MISLKDLVQKFSVLEGRQPRVMVCRTVDSPEDIDINALAVDLAGQGFDVDIGVPFDSINRLGMHALENDSDIVILIGLGPDEEEFIQSLNRFLIQKGQLETLILTKSGGTPVSLIRSKIRNWLKNRIL